MRRGAWIPALALLIATQAAQATAPAESPRPQPRPENAAPAATSAASASAPARSMRPPPRPGGTSAAVPVASAPAAPRPDPVTAVLQEVFGARPAAAAAAPDMAAGALAVARSTRPAPRPRDLFTRASAAVTAPRATSRKGSVCGVAEIKGEVIPPVTGPGACGIDNPVRVTSVSGVALRQAPTIDCTTAKALNAWVRDGVIPAVGRTGGGLARINIVAHYACRGRNNQKGARLSEHSFGRAVDVSGVTLNDGTTLTVLDHWRSDRFGKVIKAMHASACGPFGTVLGPNSDRFHQDHLHFDTARYRGGPYCR